MGEHPFRPLFVQHEPQEMRNLKHLGYSCSMYTFCKVHDAWSPVVTRMLQRFADRALAKSIRRSD